MRPGHYYRAGGQPQTEVEQSLDTYLSNPRYGDTYLSDPRYRDTYILSHRYKLKHIAVGIRINVVVFTFL